MSVTYDRIFTHDDAQSLLTKQDNIKNSIDALITALGNINNTAVYDGNGNRITTTYLPLAGGTLTGTVTESMADPTVRTAYEIKYSGLTKGTNPSANKNGYWVNVLDSNNVTIGGLYGRFNSNGNNFVGLYNDWNSTEIGLEIRSDGSENYSLRPSTHNTMTLGESSDIWKSLFCGSAYFSSNIQITNNPPRIYLKDSTLSRGTAPASDTTVGEYTICDKDAKYISRLHGVLQANGSSVTTISVYKNVSTATVAMLYFTYPSSGSVSFVPSTDNSYLLGDGTHRWKQLYAGTTTISTSDERLKDNITAIPDAVLDAWGEVGWVQYQFKDALAEKGNNARIHTGAIAQRIKAIFESHGLDAFRYGLLCYDEWDAEEEKRGEDGEIVEEARPAGNRYSLRYEEALCMEAAYQRRRADRLEERIARLEMMLNANG